MNATNLASAGTLSAMFETLGLVPASPIELALLRCEAAKREVDELVERFRLHRGLCEADDMRLSAANEAHQHAEAELKRVAADALGVDPMRLCDAIS